MHARHICDKYISFILLFSGLDKSQEDAFKFYYVTKGPLRAQGKKLYYVYGQGWDAEDGVRVKPTLTEKQGTDFAWPKKRQTNDLYYDIQIVSQGVYQVLICI